MKTRDEILATWDTKGIYAEWCAVDSYDPMDGVIRRLFVGTAEDCARMMRDCYAQPNEFAMQPFRRVSYIGADAAKSYFEGSVYELPDERGMYDVTEAAAKLDVSRQRVHQLLQDGKLDGRRVGKTWYVYRYSVELRKAGR